MNDIKKLAATITPFIEPRDVTDLAGRTGNMYESLVVISKRANQISQMVKQELHSRLEEFTHQGENIEEIMENKEQIEVSKSYERMPSPVIIALHEFLIDKLHHELREPEARVRP